MITTEFTAAVYKYLLLEGYSHLHLKGLQPVTQTGDQYYYVAPLKKNHPSIKELKLDGLATALEDQESLTLLDQLVYAKVKIEWTIAEYAAFCSAK